MSVFQRVAAFFAMSDEEEGFLETPEPEVSHPKRNVVAFAARDGRRTGGEVSIFVPHAFADVTEIADSLRMRQVVIVNLQGADRGLLQRVVDFTSGVAYTIDGRIQKLAEAMYLVVPPGVAVNAEGIRDSLGADSMLDFMNAKGTG